MTTEPGAARAPLADHPRSLRIAGLDPERRFAGGETQVLALTLELLRMGHRAELFCDPEGELGRRAAAAGIACTALRIRNSIDMRAGLALRRALGRAHYDVVHFHTARAHALAPFARGRAGALIVTRRMDYEPNRLFARWLYNRAVDGVAAISTGVADSLARAGVARERIALIPSAVDCARFRPPTADERARARAALGLDAADCAIGAVGALEPRKGHRYLIEAMALMAGDKAADGGAIRCLIAGDGSERAALAAAIARNGLGDRVVLMGAVADARALLWALDAFVMPSLNEGLGVALLEAGASGLAAVGSRCGGIVDVIVDRETGLLVAPGDARALGDAIQTLARDGAARTAMGAAARTRIARRFSIEAMARQTVELYRACLQTNAGRRGGDV